MLWGVVRRCKQDAPKIRNSYGMTEIAVADQDRNACMFILANERVS